MESASRSSIWTSVWERGRPERVFSRRVGWEDIEGGQRRRVLGVDEGADMAGAAAGATGEKSKEKSSERSMEGAIVGGVGVEEGSIAGSIVFTSQKDGSIEGCCRWMGGGSFFR